jgi:hypothetical protein
MSFNLNARAPGGDDDMEGDEWLKKQRGLAKQQAGGAVAPVAAAPAASAPFPVRPAAAVVPMAPSSATSAAGAGDTVGGRKFGDGSRVEERGDGRTAVYGPGNRFMGYSGSAVQPAVPGPGQTKLPAVTAISQQAAQREQQAQAGVAAGNDRLARARDSAAAGTLQISRTPPRVPQLTAAEIAAGASVEMRGQGPAGTATVQTRDGRTVTLSGDQMDSKQAVRAAMAPAAAPAPSAPAPSLSAAGGVTAPASAADPARPASPFQPQPPGFLDRTLMDVADTVPAAVEANRQARVALATSGSGGSANSRSVMPGVNTGGPFTAAPGESTYRGPAQIEVERPAREAAQAVQRAAQFARRTEERTRLDGEWKKRDSEAKMRQQARIQAQRKRSAIHAHDEPMTMRFADLVEAEYQALIGAQNVSQPAI